MKNRQRGYTLIELITVITMLGSIAIIVAVLIHFIAKYW